MAGTGLKLLGFLVTVHTLLYFAGASGVVAQQQGSNPHKKYVDNFRGSNLSETAAVQDDSNIIDGTFGPAVKSLSFLNVVAGIFSSPYTLVANSGLPQMYIWLVQALIGLAEATVLAGFLRGAPF